MVLNKMKHLKKASGFTIVELLIVIVVIAILAAITIVAYSGITARAKNSQAQSNVESVQKVAEAYNADTGAYPSTAAQFTAGSTSTHLPTGVTLVKPAGVTQALVSSAGASLMSTNPGFTIGVSTVVTNSVVTGGMIIYYDSTTSTTALQVIYYGNATSGSAYVALGA